MKRKFHVRCEPGEKMEIISKSYLLVFRGSKEKPLWKCINGKCYAFGEDGKMYCDCATLDGYIVDGNGSRLKI
ncbi:hypothetical protein [Clostridium beijerinckii]|uniref:hypothetical protein n=1 Tax=Clostridium beijerinckii TaxID=1520 RepID=UPI00242A5271|nr:hypothetical protein [Clostridium beijerinckii]MDG5856532.1 hypothetical protein [Clostridium beijerinckii]